MHGLWLIMLLELLEPNQYKQLGLLNLVVLQLRFESCFPMVVYAVCVGEG